MLKFLALIVLGVSLVACACPQPLPVAKAEKGKSTYKQLEQAYYQNVKTLEDYNKSLEQ